MGCCLGRPQLRSEDCRGTRGQQHHRQARSFAVGHRRGIRRALPGVGGSARGAASVTPLTLTYSPCPNDTFVFHAWAHGLIEGAPPVDVTYFDVDVANGMA